MSFELRVEFSGLCLYVVHPDGKQVGVLMPDARKTVKRLHDDGELGEAHVGWVRFDVANLAVAGLEVPAGTLPTRNSGNPPYGLVHKFDRQSLDFGLGDSREPIAADLNVPDFDQFATALTRKPNLFGDNPSPDLLMRTVITGGRIEGQPSGSIRELSSVLSPASPNASYKRAFAGFTVWTRTVDAAGLTVTIQSFDGKIKTSIPLRPAKINGKDVIAMKVANLCAHNPMEWDEFETREPARHDVDFKWLYRLMQPKSGAYRDILLGSEFPFPRATSTEPLGLEDCMGGSTGGGFPP
jgi:hypothetical protein